MESNVITQNPFTFNDTETTAAATTLFQVYLKKTRTTPVEAFRLPGYHSFEITAFPNPNDSTILQIKALLK